MILISHRGNYDGPNIKLENNPAQITKMINDGFDCEIDVWYINSHFLLGHDGPVYAVKERFLENNKLWCHAKNMSALEKMIKNKKIHCFWHENDDFTLTSRGYIWTSPRKTVCKSSVLVSLGKKIINTSLKCYGVCTDYPKILKETLSLDDGVLTQTTSQSSINSGSAIS